MHERMGAEFPQVLVQVVDERVVVVDDQDVQRNPPTIMRSMITIAATFSTTGTARGTMQGSCPPVTMISVRGIGSRSSGCCGVASAALGLTATATVSGGPWVMPPRPPPARSVPATT